MKRTTTAWHAALAPAGGILACALIVAGLSTNIAMAGSATEVSQGEAAAAMQAGAQDEQDSLQAAREAYAQTTPMASGNCVTCHTDKDMLEASLSSDDLDASTYLVSDTYVTSTHGQLGCTFCHGGDADATDAQQAMEGILADPSIDAGVTVCGQCHEDVTDVYKTSLHYTTAGLSAKYLVRTALAEDSLGTCLYNENWQQNSCMDCHQSCAMCHVTQASEDKAGHDFMLSDNNEDAQQSCLAYCHSGGLGTCFPNTDVHYKAGMSCMDCHNVTEIHGDGVYRTTMIHSGIVTTECQDCHSEDSLEGEWHSSEHLAKATCWSCHSGEYRTCANCHSWTSGGKDTDSPLAGAEESFGVTLGTDPQTGQITTLAIAPVGSEMFQDGGVDWVDMDLLNTTSAIYPAMFHSTIVPEVTQDFCNECHGEGTYLISTDQLLFPDYESDFLTDALPAVDVNDYLDD